MHILKVCSRQSEREKNREGREKKKEEEHKKKAPRLRKIIFKCCLTQTSEYGLQKCGFCGSPFKAKTSDLSYP